MQRIQDLLNKIQWDRRENPEDYEIGVIDRFTKEIEFLPFSRIERREGQFLAVKTEEGTAEIPLHRIRAIRKRGTIVWQRKISYSRVLGKI